MRRALLVLACSLVALAVGTHLAGEQTEVAMLRSFDAQGAAHDTKMWAVDHHGANPLPLRLMPTPE